MTEVVIYSDDEVQIIQTSHEDVNIICLRKDQMVTLSRIWADRFHNITSCGDTTAILLGE